MGTLGEVLTVLTNSSLGDMVTKSFFKQLDPSERFSGTLLWTISGMGRRGAGGGVIFFFQKSKKSRLHTIGRLRELL